MLVHTFKWSRMCSTWHVSACRLSGEAAVLPKAAAVAAARGAAGGRSWKRTGSSTYDESKMVDAGPPADQAGMVRCPGCERTFAPGPFEKHEKICAKVLPHLAVALGSPAARC